MVYAAVSGHLQVVSALLDTLFPALPQEAERSQGSRTACGSRISGATPGGRDPRVAQLVGSRDMSPSCTHVGCQRNRLNARLDYLPKHENSPSFALQVLEAVDELPPETQRKLRL